LTISPTISTTNAAGTTLGASIAQTTPVSSLSGPWYLKMVLTVLTTGAPGRRELDHQGDRVLPVRRCRRDRQLRPRPHFRRHVGDVRPFRQPEHLDLEDAQRGRVVDDPVGLTAAFPLMFVQPLSRAASNPSVDLDASGGTAAADGTTPVLTVTVTAATGTATASGGTVLTAEGLIATAGAAAASGTTPVLTVTLTATAGGAAASGGTVTATAGPNLVASTGAASAAGGTVALAVTLTAASGTATTGGTVSASVGLAASSGAASAQGGTISLTVILDASGGAATASGGDATLGVPLVSRDVIRAGGTQNVVRAPRPGRRPRSGSCRLPR
jgi:hypothetical protein